MLHLAGQLHDSKFVRSKVETVNLKSLSLHLDDMGLYTDVTQPSDYIKITEHKTPQGLLYLQCDYSLANSADSSHVTWLFESSPGDFVPLDANKTSVHTVSI